MAGNFNYKRVAREMVGGFSSWENYERWVRLISSRGSRTLNIAPGINDCTRWITPEDYNRGASRRIATTQFRYANVKVTYGAFRVHSRATRSDATVYNIFSSVGFLLVENGARSSSSLDVTYTHNAMISTGRYHTLRLSLLKITRLSRLHTQSIASQ